jgi:hypothetical protein
MTLEEQVINDIARVLIKHGLTLENYWDSRDDTRYYYLCGDGNVDITIDQEFQSRIRAAIMAMAQKGAQE